MEVVFILLPLALLVAALMLALFVWAVRSGQFDDLDTPAVRILFDDKPERSPKSAQASSGGAEPKRSPVARGEDTEEEHEGAEGPPASDEGREPNHLPGT